MLAFTTADAVSVLKKSNNLNSALKNFLKREIRPGDQAARFVKELRDLIDSPNPTRMESYIESARPKFERQLVAIGSYAHSNTINVILNPIAEKYADEFNQTYTSSEQGIKVTNQKKFDEIVKAALSQIDQGLAQNGFGDSKYLKNCAMLSIFDAGVLGYIFNTLK